MFYCRGEFIRQLQKGLNTWRMNSPLQDNDPPIKAYIMQGIII